MNEQQQIAAPDMGALYAALAAAQAEFQPIEKNRSVTIRPRDGAPYSFRYADLEEILAKTRPALTKNGLALFQVLNANGGATVLRCELVHGSGARLSSEVSIPSPDQLRDPKQFGAQVTYFRRYMATSMLGVAADDDLDDDGNEMPPQQQQAASSKPPVSQPQRKAATDQAQKQPAAQKKDATAGDVSLATAGEIAYITKKISGAGLTIAQARTNAGMEPSDTLEGLTRDGFVALKDLLA